MCRLESQATLKGFPTLPVQRKEHTHLPKAAAMAGGGHTAAGGDPDGGASQPQGELCWLGRSYRVSSLVT